MALPRAARAGTSPPSITEHNITYLIYYRVITSRGAKALSSSLKLEAYFWLSARAHISVGLGRRGGNISVDLSLFVLLYNTNFMTNLKFNNIFFN